MWETDVAAPTAGDAPVAVGPAPLAWNDAPVAGAIERVDGEAFYVIDHVDRMAPFFTTVVSAGDPWLFASSTGALTAGRGSPDHALFPYRTVDKIHEGQGRTGGCTLLRVARGDGAPEQLWEPFSDRYAGLYRTRRRLAKTLRGDRLRLEEVNEDLGLRFAQTWAMSERYGFVRTSELTHVGEAPVRVRVLDGVRDLMPYGIPRAMEDTRSVLTDAYKQNERLASGLGIFALSAQPVDRAEPSEALLATTVWQAGLAPDAVLLSARQLEAFRQGRPVRDERLVRAERGAYLVHATLDLAPGDVRTWDTVADIEQDAADAVALDAALAEPEALRRAVHADVAEGAARLAFLVATSDGEQATADAMAVARHRMNTLFNVMRGGVPDDGYTVRREAVRAFVAGRHAPLARAHAGWFDALPETLTVQALRAHADAADPQLGRLLAQVLPLHFSRRHGDPSRPWNHFSIETRDAGGAYAHGYEGNWRDIFQNWEALGRSFPGYLESMVAVFLNASTADGYNPYRITDGGIDWERIEPDDPWSYIGYWGDHQIIYLLRLLAQWQAHEPDRLRARLGARRFGSANVPYRIAPYHEILADPHDTVAYDTDEEGRITDRVDALGADGRLRLDAAGDVQLVTLAEKLLVPLVAKLTNFVPGGGIWMNTQRPEWNDANNALVGHGVSVVTLFAVRRYVAFLRDLLDGGPPLALSAEVADALTAIGDIVAAHPALAHRPLDDAERRAVVDALGQTGTRHREAVYAGLSGATRDMPAGEVVALLERVLAAVDQTLAENRRDDGLVHSYNLLAVHDDGLALERLYPMLEGQVAALDSGTLAPDEALRLLGALRQSDLYRADQHSYLLYPDRALPGFLEKNTVPPDVLERAPLLGRLLDAGDTSVVRRDVRDGVHFHGAFRNAADVRAALDALTLDEVSSADRQAVLDAFEAVFDHHAFTGRSGTFFGYEGLGSIYWHMISKLALATQEMLFRAADGGADPDTLAALAGAYADIRAGLGGCKTPDAYGAFPADAYSHTPAGAGAKQPGLTGQVKEDLLCRWGELGVRVVAGRVVFDARLLRADEFLDAPSTLHSVDTAGAPIAVALDAGTLAFTLCATPVVVRRAASPAVRVVGADGSVTAMEGPGLSREASAAVFARTGAVARIEVGVVPGE